MAVEPSIFIMLIIYDIGFNEAFDTIDIIKFVVFLILLIQFRAAYWLIIRVHSVP